VRRGIETYGGSGDSLLKGVVVKLSAIALSINPGGSAARGLDISYVTVRRWVLKFGPAIAAAPRHRGSSGEAEIEPDRVLDEIGREAIAAVAEGEILPDTPLAPDPVSVGAQAGARGWPRH